MDPITMVIADSIDSCRDHLEGFILKNHRDYQLLHTTGNALEVLYTSKQNRPNLVIIDVDLPGMSILDLCGQLRQHCPDTRIIVRASEDIPYHGRRMLQAGARGILSKHACNAELTHCFGWVHGGNLHLSTECRHLHVRKLSGESELSDFELAVLRGVCLRKVLKQIVEELHASLSTVRRAKDHINALVGKDDADSILRWAWMQGYISLKECWGL